MDFFSPIWNQQFQPQQYQKPTFSNLGRNTARNLRLIFQRNFNFANNNYIHKLIKDAYFLTPDHPATNHPTDGE